MNTETPTTPTIAELWDRFQKLENYIETEKILQSWGTKGSDGLSHDGRNHSNDEHEMQALRAQLIERCKRVRDVDGFTSMFEVEERNGQLVINVYFQDRRGYSSRHPRCDDANTSKEYAAAYAFWAWELEQRQRESTATAATTPTQPYLRTDTKAP